MQNKWSRATLILLSVFIAVFAATSAMAYVLTARPQEMIENSECDNAGTITITFTENDQTIINNYFTSTGRPAELRVFLSGTDVEPGIDVPTLCEDIRGGASVPGTNITDAVPLDLLGDVIGGVAQNNGEVSQIAQFGTPDAEAWVRGIGGNPFFTIYITNVSQQLWGATPTPEPFIRIGLFNPDGDPNIDLFDTPICAQVRDFADIAKLTVSINNTPTSLTTTTSDDRIGIFGGDIQVRDCISDGPIKGQPADTSETCSVPEPDSIALCPIVGDQLVECVSYYHCTVIQGDWPLNERVDLLVSAEEAGIYIQSITLRDRDSQNIISSTEVFREGRNGDEVPNADNCEFGAKFVTSSFNSSELGLVSELNGDRAVVVCLKYTINPEEAVAGNNVMFGFEGKGDPCGELFAGMTMGAALTACTTGGEEPELSCLYFPYVLSQTGPWSTGLAIANLSQEVAIADMEATFTLHDSAGNVFTYTETDFQGKMFPFVLDEAIVDWDWDATPTGAAVEPGAAWLYVEANFLVDGFNFTTDSNFGGTSLPRALRDCNMNDFR
jgi:hypothetical protein